MSKKLDKIKIGSQYDKRRKLTEEDKDNIRNMYATGMWSHRTLAEHYRVSKSLITIILNPERSEKVKNRIKEHWMDYKESKEQRAATMRKHRAYKRYLLNQNKIK